MLFTVLTDHSNVITSIISELKGHDFFFPPSELCVFHQTLWSEIHLSQVFTQRFDMSDIKQTLTDRQEKFTLSTKLFTL